MYYKLLNPIDLSETSYRCYKQVGDYIYIEYNSGFVADYWEQVSKEEIIQIVPEWFEEDEEIEEKPQLTQLDTIEALLYEVLLYQDNN